MGWLALAATAGWEGTATVQVGLPMLTLNLLRSHIFSSYLNFFRIFYRRFQKQDISVGGPDPERHVFGPRGSGSVGQRYGSRSFLFFIKMLSGLK